MTTMDEFLAVMDDSPFSETPVAVKEFVEGKHYLALPPLSTIQYECVEAMSQIYRREDLYRIMTRRDADKYYDKYTKTEVVLKLGKGSGKDFISTIACAYIVYKLLCLKDPSAYFGKPSGDAIDIINVAINAQQAKNVFFKGFKTKIEKSPWFRGKFNAKIESIDFDKAISVYSGHSERESHEGLNIILAVLDEISGFAMDNPSGLEKSKTADAIYNAFRGTVDSRFDLGKVVLLSFPRYDGCFISQKYDQVVASKEMIPKSHTFILNKNEEVEKGSFTIEWEEEHVKSYTYPGVFALCRPTWEVNPTKKIDDFTVAFYTNENDARARFLAQPSAISDAMIGRRDKIESSLVHINPLMDNMQLMPTFMPKAGMKYYMHADLAQKMDRAAVAISHVEKWVAVDYGSGYKTTQPYVVTDAVAYWEPGVGKPIDLKEVKDWIVNVRRLGFDVDLVTFDRWDGGNMQRELIELGFKAETLSVLKKHYDDLVVIMYEDRLRAPSIDILYDELKNLRIVNGKVEHPRSKSGKDLSDALCGSVFNAAARAPRNNDVVVEIHDITTKVQDYSYANDRPIQITSYDDMREEAEVYLL
jgi:hypothetical protein